MRGQEASQAGWDVVGVMAGDQSTGKGRTGALGTGGDGGQRCAAQGPRPLATFMLLWGAQPPAPLRVWSPTPERWRGTGSAPTDGAVTPKGSNWGTTLDRRPRRTWHSTAWVHASTVRELGTPRTTRHPRTRLESERHPRTTRSTARALKSHRDLVGTSSLGRGCRGRCGCLLTFVSVLNPSWPWGVRCTRFQTLVFFSRHHP